MGQVKSTEFQLVGSVLWEPSGGLLTLWPCWECPSASPARCPFPRKASPVIASSTSPQKHTAQRFNHQVLAHFDWWHKPLQLVKTSSEAVTLSSLAEHPSDLETTGI